MSENTAWQDIVQASYRLESNLDSYERGYRQGRKDEHEHAKTLRDPDRLTEIQHLQEALRRKNEKYRRLRVQYKRLKDAKVMSHDEIIEQATKVMHAKVCCPCDTNGCDWTQTLEVQYARALADSGLLTHTQHGSSRTR